MAEDQNQEYADALQEGRQPLCIWCEKPLDKICQTQYDYLVWVWDAKAKRYTKDDSGADSDKPYHYGCETGDWEFLGESDAAEALGLTF